MKIIRKAVVFKADLPHAGAMAAHIAELPFEPCGETFTQRAGFVPNSATGELLTPIEGGFTCTVRYDEKILPKASVRQALVDAEKAAVDDNDGEPLDEDAFNTLKDRVMSELIAHALVKTTIVNAFYHTQGQYLIVPASKNLAQLVINLIIKACGSVKTHTIHVDDIKGGLTTRLGNYIGGEEKAFDGFQPGQSCLLKDSDRRVSFDLSNLDDAQAGIAEALGAKMKVERMELVHEQMSFKLAKDFSISGIDYFGELTEDEEAEREDMDFPFLWRTEASVQMLQLAAAIDALCALFEYKAPESVEPSTAYDFESSGAGQADDLYKQAVDYVRSTGRASVSAIQRELKIGYNRAARMIEMMEDDGIVTPMNSHGGREVIKG